MTAAIELCDLDRRWPGPPPVHAVRSCSLRVEAGDHLAITGPSGSGKSTLLHLLGLLDVATSGMYRLFGDDVSRLDDAARSIERARRIGFVFQAFHLLAHRTATENVELGMTYTQHRRAERPRRAAEALDRVGLSHRARGQTTVLSGGERQRVAIARALVAEPCLLLADEPTGSLDSQSTDAILDLFDELRAGGLTIVVVTHETAVARRARRIATMVDGILTETPGG